MVVVFVVAVVVVIVCCSCDTGCGDVYEKGGMEILRRMIYGLGREP